MQRGAGRAQNGLALLHGQRTIGGSSAGFMFTMKSSTDITKFSNFDEISHARKIAPAPAPDKITEAVGPPGASLVLPILIRTKGAPSFSRSLRKGGKPYGLRHERWPQLE